MTHTERQHVVRPWLIRACIALPLLMLVANVLAWLRWGTDLPFLDDWRVYDQRNALSLDPARLFRAVNNTLAPIGLGLDALAQRWLGGNPLPYQTLSMVAGLGGLLCLQWRLLGWVAGNRLHQAAWFAFCIPMLQSGSYWGEQSLAYHQALPLLWLLGAMGLMLSGHGGRPWRGGLVFLLGLLAGLSYISGAAAALVLGVSWVFLGWFFRGDLRVSALMANARTGGWALALAGASTCAAQLYLTRAPERIEGVQQYLGLTWPDTADFWIYLFGKIGRSTGHGFESVALELAWTSAVCLAWLAAVAWTLRRGLARSAPRSARWRRLALVLAPLSATVFSYLALVSFGRAGFRDPSIRDVTQIFQFSYERFHFFWVTLLFPWLAAALTLCLRRVAVMPILIGALLVLSALGAARGIFDVTSHYRNAARARAHDLACLHRQIGSAKPINCLELGWMGIPDLARAYAYARDIDASFVRYLPLTSRDGFGQTLIHWSRPEDFAVASQRHSAPAADGWFQSDGDVQWYVPLPPVIADFGLDRCRTLGVRMQLLTRGPALTQIFFRPSGVAAYDEAASVRQRHSPDSLGRVSIEFSIDSRRGFEPELRIDPIDTAGYFKWTELRVTCRLWDLP